MQRTKRLTRSYSYMLTRLSQVLPRYETPSPAQDLCGAFHSTIGHPQTQLSLLSDKTDKTWPGMQHNFLISTQGRLGVGPVSVALLLLFLLLHFRFF
jgi:hypothetical protein